MRALLDVNVWITLFDDAHQFLDRANLFIAKRGVQVASCPLVGKRRHPRGELTPPQPPWRTCHPAGSRAAARGLQPARPCFAGA